MAGMGLMYSRDVPEGILEMRHREFFKKHGACFTNIGGEDSLDYNTEYAHICVNRAESTEVLAYCRLIPHGYSHESRGHGLEIQKFFNARRSVKAMKYLLEVVLEICSKYKGGYLIADVTDESIGIIKALLDVTVSQQTHHREFFGQRAVYHIRPKQQS